MSISLLIAISFSIGFFIESIIGFGGGLVAYSVLAFFFSDFKSMIIAGLYIGTCSSAYIFYTDYKSLDKKIFYSLIPLSVVGSLFGVFVFSKSDSKILTLIFGILLILLSVRIIFFERFKFPKFLKNKLILIGGISQGAFGIGGPFVVNAVQSEFKNKSSLRATMALFFIFLNLIRFFQLTLQHQLNYGFIYSILWVIIPVFIAIKFGHLLHLKISEGLFKRGVALMTIIAGIKFLSSII